MSTVPSRSQSPSPSPMPPAIRNLTVILVGAASLPSPSAEAFSIGGGVLGNPIGICRRKTCLNLFDFRPNGSEDDGRRVKTREWNIPPQAVSELSRGAGRDEAGETEMPVASAQFPYRIELDRSTDDSPRRSSPPSYRKVVGKINSLRPSGGVATATSTATSAATMASSTASSPRKIVTVRHLKKSDLPHAVKMCVAEFGTQPSSEEQPDQGQRLPGYAVVQPTASTEPDLDLGKVMERAVEPYLAKIENFYFAWVVRNGLGDRIERRKAGEGGRDRGVVSDHNVVCITEKTVHHPSSMGGQGQRVYSKDDEEGEEILVGLAELSLQPTDPYRTAPPYVLPVPVKRLLSRYYSAGTPGGQNSDLCAYVSNVLVRPDKRGLGYGRALMAAAEGLARDWGYESVTLHVDADTTSGREAQALYRSMGYEGVPDDGRYSRGGQGGVSPYAWMGADMVQRGLYVVEGVPLLYLRKELVNGR